MKFPKINVVSVTNPFKLLDRLELNFRGLIAATVIYVVKEKPHR